MIEQTYTTGTDTKGKDLIKLCPTNQVLNLTHWWRRH